MISQSRILVTGATGYVGSQLVPRLLEGGRLVRVMVRDLGARNWPREVEVAQADVREPGTLASALEGVDTAYYLIHSMTAGQAFHQEDVQAARNFAQAAERAGVQRLIYLGALGDPAQALSPHLSSRQRTGDALRESGPPVTEFRAAVIVGAGSLSFEMIRYLTEHVPLMICPRWVYTRIQPIAISNTLDYLEGALEQPESIGQIIEIGGAQQLTYGQMMTEYARIRGLRRILLPVPVLTPHLSSLWVHLVTPIPSRIAQPLIEGLRNEVVVRDHLAEQLFPDIKLIDYPTAVRTALEALRPRAVAPQEGRQVVWQDGMIIEQRSTRTRRSPSQLFHAVARLGGKRGWLFWNWAWQLRGALDRLLGGVGMRRRAGTVRELQVGEQVDFWRVEAVEQRRLLRFRAEMRLPGEAWLEFRIHPLPAGRALLQQAAYYAPKGLFGLIYWWVLYPVHALIFGGMLRRLTQADE